MKKTILSAITLTLLVSSQSFGAGLLDVLSSAQVRVLDGVLTAVENGRKGSKVSNTGFEEPEYQSYNCEKLEDTINIRISDRDHRIYEAEEIKKIIKEHDDKNAVHKFFIEEFTSFSRQGTIIEGFMHMNASKIIDAEIYNMERFYNGKCK